MADDSDDDLIAPVFLVVPVKQPNEILTPQKGRKPDEDPSLSPLSPFNKLTRKTTQRNKVSKARFSLSSLLTEKEKININKKRVDDIIELESKFCDRNYFENFDEESNIDSSQHLSESQQEFEYSQSQETLSFDIFSPSSYDPDVNEKNIKKVNDMLKHDFAEMFPGLRLILHPTETVLLERFLITLTTYIDGQVNDMELDDEDPKDLLLDIILTCIPTNCILPNDVCQTLLEILYSIEDYETSQAAYLTLTNIVTQSHRNRSKWMPTVSNFMEALSHLGTDMAKLTKEFPSNYIHKSMNHVQPNNDDDNECYTDIRSIRKEFSNRLHNFTFLVQFFSVCLQQKPSFYSIEDLDCILVVSFLLSIEKLFKLSLWNIKTLIGAVLDAYGDSQWNDQLCKIVNEVSHLPAHHHNKVHIVNMVPPTKRGIQFQQNLAFSTICNIRKINDLNCKYVKPSDVLSLLRKIEINEESDYYELHSVFSIMLVVLATDDINSSQKANLKKLCVTLNKMYSQIKEVRGAYLDRTKVKDVILRLVSKYTYGEQSLRKTQCHLENYFEKLEDVTKIEYLKQSYSDSDSEMESENRTVHHKDALAQRDFNSSIEQVVDNISNNLNTLTEGKLRFC